MIAALLLSPLLTGVIVRTKALAAGRRGPPLLQPYLDLWRLLHKGTVTSRTATALFRTGPMVALSAAVAAAALLPSDGRIWVSFPGDLLLLTGLLGLMRFAMVLAALDTGSSFEGMGASREAAFSALVEPALLLGLAALARVTGRLSVGGMLAGAWAAPWSQAGPVSFLVAAALFVVFLAENARIPFDDPGTHLELTMIHEVMVLDHSGPDLAFIHYAAAIKLWVLGALVVGILVPPTAPAYALGLLGLAVATGIVESCMARLRLARVPHLIAGATALSAVALLLALRGPA